MTDANSDDVLLNFIQNEVTQSADIRTLSIFSRDFNSAHPDHAAPGKDIQSRIRKVLRNIPHEKYNDTTLAKMMFCLAQPLTSVNLRKVKERLDKSGILRLDKISVITYYKNNEVELQGAHQRRNKRERAKDERNRRETFANLEVKFERQMEEESRELGEREKEREEADRRAEEDRIRIDLYDALPEDWGFDDPNLSSTSDQGKRPRIVEDPAEEEEEVSAPVTKRARVKESGIVTQKNIPSALSETPRRQVQEADSNSSFLSNWGFNYPDTPSTSVPVRPLSIEIQANENQEVRAPVTSNSVVVSQTTLPEFPCPQIHGADSTVISMGSFPAPNIFGSQETCYYYYELMQRIHSLTLVLEDTTLESLRSEVIEELAKPESIPKIILESKISEALDDGIKIAVKSAKSDNIQQSMGLIEFMRLLKLQILNIGFRTENGCVTKINDIINGSSQGMMIPMAKVRFAMETIFEKIRQ